MAEHRRKPAAADAERPPRLVRTTVIAVLCLIWAALGLCGAAVQLLQLTMFPDMQRNQLAAAQAQLEAAQAQVVASRTAQIEQLQSQRDAAATAGDAAEVARLDGQIAALQAAPPPAPNPMLAGLVKMQELLNRDDWKAWQWVGMCVGWVSTGLLIAAGVGLLMRRPFGRTLGVGAAGVLLASTGVGMVTMSLLLSEMGGMQQLAMNPTAMGMAAGFVVSVGCGLIFPLAMLAILLSRTVRAEFEEFARFRG